MVLNRAIKVSGVHPVAVNLYRSISATVNALVGVTEEQLAAEEAEAAAEAAAAEGEETLAEELVEVAEEVEAEAEEAAE